MFDQPRESWHLPSWLLKLVVISACTLGVGLGLCGVDAHLHPQGDGSMLAFFGFVLMVVAALALGLVVLILLVSLIALMFRRS